jgi:hypothetical protein
MEDTIAAVKDTSTGSASRSPETHQQACDIRHCVSHDDVCASRVQVRMDTWIVFRPKFSLVVHIGIPSDEGVYTLLYRGKDSGIALRPLPDEDYRATLGANPANDLFKTVRNIAGRVKEQIPIVVAELNDRELCKQFCAKTREPFGSACLSLYARARA